MYLCIHISICYKYTLVCITYAHILNKYYAHILNKYYTYTPFTVITLSGDNPLSRDPEYQNACSPGTHFKSVCPLVSSYVVLVYFHTHYTLQHVYI